MIPSTVHVKFGQALWKNVKLEAGKTIVLNPGVFTLIGKLEANKLFQIRDAKAKPAAYLTAKRPSVPLPPGRYELELDNDRIPFTLQEGKAVKLKLEYQ